MLGDGDVDRMPRLILEPGLEDSAVGASIGGDAMDHQLIVEGHDARAADPRYGRDHADPMEPATERDTAAVSRTAACGDAPSHLRLTAEVLAEPGLTFREERGGTTLVLGPDGPGRDRDDDASLRVDDDTQHTGTGRPPQGVRERAAG